ncbi:aminotransferase class V-fold PLP-dependent enzyme [Paraburkholderia silvatlantica]|uniref:Aspartate aminotransferase-like enzyme n=2 Tax=Paraburkholderia silvatlantica TaxID=321895 RepID=A0A2U0ZGF0_9BURK|nr:aminotransferase class V-fold PLP-dependent enzyme [Paraburkholderia silvatlantica]PVY17898.1 aspartate aminotransferase-like enzyme [Paraburkholderia silvatlantica]PXW23817.1 aspartate aminotransferase-like enzyme [Paraburkholderia silvatlantica]PYE12710.1 aspartate aminotransferase-like enzyme [Paraburkholderia silvatlantica]TDQ73608.1 aspartate aminotransferase-like enzyme [Paraburkholderia silvatlantica]
MPGLLPNVDREGLLEYSVVYTDRSINHMSQRFQGVMRDISRSLKKVYNANSVVVVPGSGTFGMEAVARQFATNRKCLVIRNGWFSFRWSQIFDMGSIPAESIVLKARPVEHGRQAAYAPPPIDEVVAAIKENKPDLVFAPHVETASGMMLPDAYLRAVADAVHAAGGMFVLDCIASGTVWVDMEASGVDILISAPQKGWSASPCCALVMLGPLARERIDATTSTSFACDLRKWLQIMQAYENGGFAYHATMPTDSLATLRDVIKETEAYGFDKVMAEQLELGRRIRSLLVSKGFRSVAAEGFEAPGVVVSYSDDDGIRSGKKFADAGLQIAAGVPLQCDEPEDFNTFRIGLFGLEKLHDIEGTVSRFAKALDRIL